MPLGFPRELPQPLVETLERQLLALTRPLKTRPCLDNGSLELDNNTAEWAMRPVALGRKNYLFMGSEGGGKAAAVAYTFIEAAKLNNVAPSSLARLGSYPNL
ncbi:MULTISPECIES: transposase [unclassified Pseudovibrio]|uniref:IS66 family transposase n=1 Tax=unclassified Pseudovibrio TaxID=2627060 RepID=UPI0007AEA0CA|nr:MULTISPECIES: transposase [unclassified Pseudovibrio]KZL02605.1 Transposase IS66 family protein [Pseudovibrio sp. W74]KZL07852.1 Transposase IS66 family protein [Pseudovibrio sp. Ad14]